MTLMVYVLVGAHDAGWLSARTLGTGGVAALLILLFVLRQRTSPDPLLPLRIFRSRALRGANVVAALINMAIGPVIFFLSLYTQQVLDYSAFAAGLAIVPVILTVTVSSTMAGWLLRRMSQRAVMSAGLVLFAAGLVWMHGISGGAYWSELLGPECLVGLGGGLVFVTFTVSGTSGLAERDSGSASGGPHHGAEGRRLVRAGDPDHDCGQPDPGSGRRRGRRPPPRVPHGDPGGRGAGGAGACGDGDMAARQRHSGRREFRRRPAAAPHPGPDADSGRIRITGLVPSNHA
ncbi:hypothetical protein GCM10020000_77230 [Streptomyces olivoverticillatus]